MTALHIAVHLNYTQFVEKLLNVSGIELDPKTEFGATPFYMAAAFGYVEILKLLHAAGADISGYCNKCFNTEYRNGNGLMPIHIAVYYGDLPVVETIIQLGEDVDVVSDYFKFTPLIFAAFYAHADVVEYLLEMGADCDIQSDYERTALDWASLYHGMPGMDEVVEVLNNGCG